MAAAGSAAPSAAAMIRVTAAPQGAARKHSVSSRSGFIGASLLPNRVQPKLYSIALCTICRLLDRQRKAKDTAYADLALNCDRATMQLHKRLGDREPKASAAHSIAQRRLGAVKVRE